MHITIAGKLGSGKSTVGKLLCAEHGFEIYSTGKIQRELARSFGVSTLEMNQLMSKDTKYDHMIDDAVTKLSVERENDRLLFDSRMAWHFAKNSFRVFFTIDPQIAAIRVMKDPRGVEETYVDVDDAREKLIARSLVENERFRTIYGTDNLNYSNYDLVVDTSYAAPETIAKLVFAEYEKFCADESAYVKKMYFSPKSLYPSIDAEQISSLDFESLIHKIQSEGYIPEPISAVCIDSYNFVADGHKRALAAANVGLEYITAYLPNEGELEVIKARAAEAGRAAMEAFEARGDFKYPSCPSIFK